MVSRLKCKEILRSNALLLTTLFGVIAGFAIGFPLRSANPSSDAKVWIGLPGEIFLRMVRMMILPLVVSSVISGTASMNPRVNGKMSLVALGFILTNNLLGCIFGIILAVTIKPGQFALGNSTAPAPDTQSLRTEDIFADLIRNVFPENLITACFQKSQTYYDILTFNNETVFNRKLGKSNSPNIIGIIFCAMVLGISTSALGDAGRPFHNFFKSAMEVVLKLLRWFIWFAPIGVASLIIISIVNVEDLQSQFLRLGFFILTVTVGVGFQQLVFIPILYFLCFYSNPFTFMINVLPAWSIAFASTSSAVAIPEMIECAEKRQGVDKRVARFVVPFSVTLGAGSSALFIVVSSIFIGQMNPVELDAGKIVVIGVLTAVSVMALPAVPSSSVAVVIIILETLNFPVEDVALVFAVEWFLDRIRTASNAVSHTFCAMFTYRWCKHNLPSHEEEDLYINITAKHYLNPNTCDTESANDMKMKEPEKL